MKKDDNITLTTIKGLAKANGLYFLPRASMEKERQLVFSVSHTLITRVDYTLNKEDETVDSMKIHTNMIFLPEFNISSIEINSRHPKKYYQYLLQTNFSSIYDIARSFSNTCSDMDDYEKSLHKCYNTLLAMGYKSMRTKIGMYDYVEVKPDLYDKYSKLGVASRIFSKKSHLYVDPIIVRVCRIEFRHNSSECLINDHYLMTDREKLSEITCDGNFLNSQMHLASINNALYKDIILDDISKWVSKLS